MSNVIFVNFEPEWLSDESYDEVMADMAGYQRPRFIGNKQVIDCTRSDINREIEILVRDFNERLSDILEKYNGH